MRFYPRKKRTIDNYFWLTNSAYAIIDFVTGEVQVIFNDELFKTYYYVKEITVQDITNIKNDIKNDTENIIIWEECC